MDDWVDCDAMELSPVMAGGITISETRRKRTGSESTFIAGGILFGLYEPSAQQCVLLLEFVDTIEGVYKLRPSLVGRGELGNLALETFDVVLCPLSYRALRLSVVRSLSLQLRWAKTRNTARARPRWPRFRAWLTHGRLHL